MASDDVIPSFASISGVDPFSLALGIRYLGEVNSVRSDRCHGGMSIFYIYIYIYIHVYSLNIHWSKILLLQKAPVWDLSCEYNQMVLT